VAAAGSTALNSNLVTAANSLLATLTDTQRCAVMFASPNWSDNCLLGGSPVAFADEDVVVAEWPRTASDGLSGGQASLGAAQEIAFREGCRPADRGSKLNGNTVNSSGQTHPVPPFHNIQFQILNRTGASHALAELGRKNTVMVRPGETVPLLVQFAYSPIPICRTCITPTSSNTRIRV
jgi:hypothetical protein